jgi:hypothetical protein
MKTFGLAAVCAVSVLALAGCDDDDDNITDPGGGTGGTASCAQTVAAEEQETVGAGVTRIPFTTTASGRVDVTVQWTSSDARVSAFVAQAGSCNDSQFTGGQCTFAGRSAGTGGGTDSAAAFTGSSPGRFAVQNAAAGSWELILTSYGADDDDDDENNDEAVAVQVVSSVGSGCPAFPPAS